MRVAIPRIADIAGVDVVPGRAVGELHHVERAEPERAGGLEPLHRGRGRRRDPAFADLRAAFGELALGVVHVLVGERHAVQRPLRLAGGKRAIRRLGGFQRVLGLDPRERVERRLPFVDARDQRLGDFDRRDLAPPDRGREVLQVHAAAMSLTGRHPCAARRGSSTARSPVASRCSRPHSARPSASRRARCARALVGKRDARSGGERRDPFR